MGFLDGSVGKESTYSVGRPGFDPLVGKIPLEKGTATHSSILVWNIVYGVVKSWTATLTFHFHFICPVNKSALGFFKVGTGQFFISEYSAFFLSCTYSR